MLYQREAILRGVSNATATMLHNREAILRVMSGESPLLRAPLI